MCGVLHRRLARQLSCVLSTLSTQQPTLPCVLWCAVQETTTLFCTMGVGVPLKSCAVTTLFKVGAVAGGAERMSLCMLGCWHVVSSCCPSIFQACMLVVCCAVLCRSG